MPSEAFTNAKAAFEAAFTSLPFKHRRPLAPLYRQLIDTTLSEMLQLDLTENVFDYQGLLEKTPIDSPLVAQRLLRTVSIAALARFLSEGSLSTVEQSELFWIIFKAYELSAEQIRDNIDEYLNAE
jgi:hypothetical protein